MAKPAAKNTEAAEANSRTAKSAEPAPKKPAKDAAAPRAAKATGESRKRVKDPGAGGGVTASASFDAKFLEAQRKLLLEERARLTRQAKSLEDEANQLMDDLEPGDVQFDDESGEGDSIVVERERDLALSAQARETVAQIDAALARIDDGTYGYSSVSGRPIPRERLKAIPWATELVEEKVGGLGSRR